MVNQQVFACDEDAFRGMPFVTEDGPSQILGSSSIHQLLLSIGQTGGPSILV